MHIKFVQNKSQTRHRLVLAAKPYLSTLRCLLKDCICSKNSWLNCTRYLSIVSYGYVCFFTPVVLLTLHSFCLPTNFIKICSSNNTAPLISFKTSIIVCLTIQYIIFSVFACNCQFIQTYFPIASCLCHVLKIKTKKIKLSLLTKITQI